MAEALGLAAGIASFISLANETAKAGHHLCRLVGRYKNASTGINALSEELTSLASTVELLHLSLESWQGRPVLGERIKNEIETTLESLRRDFRAIKKMMIDVGAATEADMKVKAKLKWVFKKADVDSALSALEKKHQALQTQIALLQM